MTVYVLPAVVTGRVVGIDVEVVGGVRVPLILRGRRVVAARASVVEVVVPASSSRRQENGAAVGITGELASIDSVHRRPFVSTVVEQFYLLVVRRHHPRATPLVMCHVVLSARDVTAKVGIEESIQILLISII